MDKFIDILRHIRDVIYPEITSKYNMIIGINPQGLDGKVDKVTGKGLSSEDFTTDEKNKLATIAENSNNYTHPSTHPVSILNGYGNPAKFVKTDGVGNAGWHDVTWSDVAGKPSSFLPSEHVHSLHDIVDAGLKADKSDMLSGLNSKVDKTDLGTNIPLLVNGKIPAIYFGSMTTMDVFTASSEANMLMLTNAGVGDQCVRSDLNTNNVFILKQLPPSDIGNWIQLSTSAAVNSVNGMIGAVEIDKTTVGLENVDNTPDLSKPLSTDAINALALKAPLESPTFVGTVGGITKGMVGLGNVDNTSDLSKPLSTAAINALSMKVDISELGVSVATLVNGVVPANQLPSFVDDVLEYTSIVSFPSVGDSGKIYTAIDTNRIYRWAGSSYIEVSSAGVSDSAVKLQTPRLINGEAFDGTANINIEARMANAIASSATTQIGAKGGGDTIHIAGTTTITSFGAAQVGTLRRVVFDGSLTLIHNSTTLILPTAANIITSAGDTAEFVCENAIGYWRCTGYQRNDGTPVASISSDISGVFANSQEFTASGTFTVPAGVNKVAVLLGAPGGGGGGGGTGTGKGNGRGGGGAAAVWLPLVFVDVEPGQSITVIVGAGGVGGGTSTNGGNGGTTSFGSIIAIGGIGGKGGASILTTGSGGGGGGAGASYGAHEGLGGTVASGSSGTAGGNETYPSLGINSIATGGTNVGAIAGVGGTSIVNNGQSSPSGTTGGAGGAGKVIVYW